MTRGAFSVVPHVEDFDLTARGLDLTKWYFTWQPHPLAVHGYAVLVALTSGEGYGGQTDGGDRVRLALALDMLKGGDPYFAIAPRFADGSHAKAQRSIAPKVPMHLARR